MVKAVLRAISPLQFAVYWRLSLIFVFSAFLFFLDILAAAAVENTCGHGNDSTRSGSNLSEPAEISEQIYEWTIFIWSQEIRLTMSSEISLTPSSQVYQSDPVLPEQNLERYMWSPPTFPSMHSSYTCPQQDWDFQTMPQNALNSAFTYEFHQPDIFHLPNSLNSFFSQTSDPSLWGPPERTLLQLEGPSSGNTSLDAWGQGHFNTTEIPDDVFPSGGQGMPVFPLTPGPSPHQHSYGSGPFDKCGETAFMWEDGACASVKQEKPKRVTRGRGGRGGGRGRGERRGRRGGVARQQRRKPKDSGEPPLYLCSGLRLEGAEPGQIRLEEAESGQTLLEGAEPGQTWQHCSLMSIATDREPYYRPPPMLRPVRQIPCQFSEGNTPAVETSGLSAPCVNVGRCFQAEVPPLRNRSHAHSDSHNAMLLWRPLEMEQDVNQERVEALLKLSQSCVVPGGGANAEDVLLLLSQSGGDFLLTLEKLLTFPQRVDKRKASNSDHI
uniref:ELM2 domain-containing protein n=1 Tax=Knipowitschia caucasica TaxID=637954 RepID=A0AAV2LCH2_KNICA